MEKTVKNTDLVATTIVRYALELITKESLKMIESVGGHEEYLKLMASAKDGQITDAQLENAVLYYAMRPEEMESDLDALFSVIKKMALAARKGTE